MSKQNEKKIIEPTHNAKTDEKMLQNAINISKQALEKFKLEREVACFIKKEFDKQYNKSWHCIVGKRVS